MTRNKIQRASTATVVCAALVTAVATSQPAFAQVSFEGKTIRFEIASTPSGPTDTAGRVFAPHIARYLPGKPAVVIDNRPGAAGVIAANYIYNVARPDGLTVGVLLGMVTSGLMQIGGVQYTPAKFQIVGAISATQVLLVRKDVGLKTAADFLKPAKPLVLASLGAGSTTDAANRLFLDAIGAKYRFVTGYPGQAETILALSRDEANLANASHTTYLQRRQAIQQEGLYDAFLQRGELTPQGGFKRNVSLPDLPSIVEAIEQMQPDALNGGDFAAYRSVVGSMAVHYSLVLPPRTPPDIVETLRKAMAQALDDPQTRKSVQDMIKSDYDFVTGADSQKLVQELEKSYDADPRVGARLKEIMAVK